MLLSEQKNEILRLATEASSWSNLHFNLNDLKLSLRSPLLNPNVELWDYVKNDQYKKKVVSDLCSKRAEFIASKDIKPEGGLNGRILCFYPEISLKDAVVCLASSGFIDEDDSPPWDSWFYYSLEDIEKYHDEGHSCLYSWVPGDLVGKLDRAISEDTYDCLIWGDVLEKELGISSS